MTVRGEAQLFCEMAGPLRHLTIKVAQVNDLFFDFWSYYFGPFILTFRNDFHFFSGLLKQILVFVRVGLGFEAGLHAVSCFPSHTTWLVQAAIIAFCRFFMFFSHRFFWTFFQVVLPFQNMP